MPQMIKIGDRGVDRELDRMNLFSHLKNIIIFVYFILGIGPLVFAETAKVTVETHLESDVVSAAVPFEFDVVVTVQGDDDVSEPHFPDVPGLTIQGKNSSLSMQSQLTSTPQGMQFIKKKIQTYRYALVAKHEGNYQISAIDVTVAGTVYKSKPVSVKVDNKLAGQQNSRGKKQKTPKGGRPQIPQVPGMPNLQNLFDEDEEDSLLGQLLQRQQQMQDENNFGGGIGGGRGQKDQVPHRQLPQVNANEAFFITVELDKTVAYEGEQIFANWFIYTRGDLYQLDRLKFPSLKGFWKEDVEPAPALIYQTEIINGVPFRKALLASYAIFPIKEGQAIVDEYKVRAQVALPVPGFGGFSFGKPFTYSRTSERVPIKVVPLPSDKPKSFSGAVGVYDITMRVDDQQIQQWKPFNLRIRFEGEGNAKFIDPPAIDFPKSFDVFDTKSEAKFFKSGKSYKEFVIQLVPKESGTVTIPSVSLSYFDTTTKQYVIRQSDPLNLNVLPGEKPANYSSERVQLDDLKPKNQTQLPELKTKLSDHNLVWLGGSMGLWIWIILELVLFAGLFFIYLFLTRSKNFSRDLKKWLEQREQKIQNLIAKKDIRNAAAESLNVIYRVLGGVSDDGNSGLELFRLIEHLPPSVRHAVGDDLIKLVERWQILAFAPEAAWGEWKQDQKIQDLFTNTHAAIIKMIESKFETQI